MRSETGRVGKSSLEQLLGARCHILDAELGRKPQQRFEKLGRQRFRVDLAQEALGRFRFVEFESDFRDHHTLDGPLTCQLRRHRSERLPRESVQFGFSQQLEPPERLEIIVVGRQRVDLAQNRAKLTCRDRSGPKHPEGRQGIGPAFLERPLRGHPFPRRTSTDLGSPV